MKKQICLLAGLIIISIGSIAQKQALLKAEDYILTTFKKCNIIGLSEGRHGLEDSHVFFRKLLADKRIQKTIDILIIEFGSVAYQNVLDDYIFGGNIDIKNLRKVWRESGQNTTGHWDSHVYMDLLEQIRNVNLTMPEGEKIRVLAGDPAIDWKSITSMKDYFKYLPGRDVTPAHLAFEHGINQNKKVLIIYGGVHLVKISDEKKDSTRWSITTLVNKRKPGSMKAIEVLDTQEFNMNEETKNWPRYSIIDLEKDKVGELPAGKIFPSLYDLNGNKVEPYKGYKTRDIFDAFYYIGNSDSWKVSEVAKEVYQDDDYWNEINRRSKIIWDEPLDEKLRH